MSIETIEMILVCVSNAEAREINRQYLRDMAIFDHRIPPLVAHRIPPLVIVSVGDRVLMRYNNMSHYFIRFEYQTRGSLHIHGLIYTPSGIGEVMSDGVYSREVQTSAVPGGSYAFLRMGDSEQIRPVLDSPHYLP
jgi:hypothetical protein